MGLRSDAIKAFKSEMSKSEAEKRRIIIGDIRDALERILPQEYHERMVDMPDWSAMVQHEYLKEMGIESPVPKNLDRYPVVSVDDVLFTDSPHDSGSVRLIGVCSVCGEAVRDERDISEFYLVGEYLETFPPSWVHSHNSDATNVCPFLSIGSDSWQACLKEKCRIFEKVEQECPFRLIGQFISVEFARAASREI